MIMCQGTLILQELLQYILGIQQSFNAYLLLNGHGIGCPVGLDVARHAQQVELCAGLDLEAGRQRLRLLRPPRDDLAVDTASAFKGTAVIQVLQAVMRKNQIRRVGKVAVGQDEEEEEES